MSEAGATRAATTLEGFAVLGVAIKREPWIFALSTVGSVLFGALTVADAWVLGWSTQHVLLPAFENGEIDSSLLVAVLALFLGRGPAARGRHRGPPARGRRSCSTACRPTAAAP